MPASAASRIARRRRRRHRRSTLVLAPVLATLARRCPNTGKALVHDAPLAGVQPPPPSRRSVFAASAFRGKSRPRRSKPGPPHESLVSEDSPWSAHPCRLTNATTLPRAVGPLSAAVGDGQAGFKPGPLVPCSSRWCQPSPHGTREGHRGATDAHPRPGSRGILRQHLRAS